MTNAEKYLKDGVDIEKMAEEMVDLWNFPPCEGICPADIVDYFNMQTKPTLTEDERAILRNISYDSEYKYIYRSLGMLYLSENERLTCADRLPGMHHLFQFIKERRRI